MFPEEAAEERQYHERLNALKKELSKVPLSVFNVGELKALLKLVRARDGEKLTPSEFEILEAKTPPQK
jgi:hypothetical protein